MSEQRTLKKLQWNGSDVIVEVANRDGSGNVITSTYATQSALTTGLNGKEPTVTLGTGLERRSGATQTYDLKIASDSALGGIKVGSGLSITSAGVLSVGEAGSVAWSNVSSKPFASLSSDFSVSSNTLSINSTTWATKAFIADNYVSLTTYNAFVNTTAPATYHPKIDSDHKLAYSLLSGAPSKVSDFTNDSGFITKSVSDLTNYYKKTDTYTKSEIEALVNAVNAFEYVIAAELPTAGSSTMYKIYLIPSSHTATNNAKDEFITIRSGTEGSYTYSWEQIGSTTVDLSNYVSASANLPSNEILLGNGTKTAKTSSKTIATGNLANSSSTIPTSDIVYAAVGAKQNTLTSSNAGNGISITTSNGVQTIASVITATDVTLTY